MSDSTRGNPRGNKTRAVRRGANRNAFADLYLIYLIFISDIEADLRVGAGSITQETLSHHRANLNAWARMYDLMGGNFSYGKSTTDQPQTLEATSVEEVQPSPPSLAGREQRRTPGG